MSKMQAAIEFTGWTADETVKKAVFLQGVEPRSTSPDEMARHIASEVEAYRNIVTEF